MSTRALAALLGASLASLPACSRENAERATATSSPSASAPPVTSATPGAIASAASSSAAAPAGKQDLKGTYTSAPGSFFVPDGGEWANTKWRGEESKLGLGDGQILLHIEGTEVRGSIEGPLGPALVRGVVSEGQIAAWIDRKDPTDGGFTGTLVATLEGTGGKGTGSMRLSLADARVIREAKFTLGS